MSRDDTSPHDELDELRRIGSDLDMPGTIRPADHGVELESADDFIARMQRRDAEAAPDAPTPLHAPSRTGRWVRVGAAAAAVLAVTGLVVASPWSEQSARAETPAILDYALAKADDIAFAPGESARDDLLQLADTARNAPAVDTTAGTVQYVQTDNWFASLEDAGVDSQNGVTPTVIQTWTSPDGSQTVIEEPGEELGPNGRGLMEIVRAATPSKDQTFPPGNADPDSVTGLGTSPDEVRTALLALGGCEPNIPDTVRASCLYQEVVGLFNQNVVPPATAAAMWTVLAAEPGFRSLGRVTDRAGRPGIGISVISSDVPEYRSVLIISPTNGQLIGKEEILIKSDTELGLQAPLVTAFSAILSATFTADRPQPR